VGGGNGVELGKVDADRGACLCAQTSLFGDGESHQIEQRAPDKRRSIFTDDPAGGVDNDNGTAAQPVRGVDGGDWLADDVPSRRVCVEAVNFGQDGINHFKLKSPLEGVEVVAPPGLNAGVVQRAQDLATEERV